MGWEPEEYHEFVFDDDGRHVGSIVTREPEWDDTQRDAMLNLIEFETGVCDCGIHESIADTDPDLELVDRICPVCKGLAKARRVLGHEDQQLEQRFKDKPSVARPSDGRHMSLREKKPPESEGATEATR